MSKIISMEGKTLVDTGKKDPEVGKFRIVLQDEQFIEATGFLVVTSVFVAVGRGEGEIVAMVPMSQVRSVEKID